MKRHIRLRSKLLFALCIALPLIPFVAWVSLLTTICSNPRKPDPITHHVNAYSCHGMTVFISDFENALLHWIIPIGGGVFILLGIVAGIAAVLSLVHVRVDVQVKRMVSSDADGADGGKNP